MFNIDELRALRLKLWMVRKLISLPPALLRAFSGGAAEHIEGRTLDAAYQFMGRSLFDQGDRAPLSIASRTIDQARQEWADMAALLSVNARGRVTFETLHGETTASGFGGVSPVNGLLVKPSFIDPTRPALVLFHQGGGIIGGPDISKAFAFQVAMTLNCPVFLPEYRLAPSARFPAALEDAHAAFSWAQSHATRLGVAEGAVALGGILMGANLALRVSLDLRRDFKPLPAALMLITPLVDLSDESLRKGPYAQSWPISGADIETLIAHYAGAGTILDSPQASPLKEGLINGQPPTLVVSAGFDPLAKQADQLVKRLQDSGARVAYRRYDTLPLGFDLFATTEPISIAAVTDLSQCFARLVD